MKNKKAEQIAAKRRHLEQLKANRRIAPNLERPAPQMLVRQTFLIVCEGTNTEPSYFRQFRLKSAIIKPVGEGYNTLSLVNRAILLKNEGEYDQVWCVFDKDDFSNEDFNNAISLANQRGISVAFSNQSFEYWILLHLDDHQGGGMHRREYNSRINQLLRPFQLAYDGEGAKIITENLFQFLESEDAKAKKDRRSLAIDRAKRNYEKHHHSNNALKESATTVYLLVKEILKFS